MIPTRHRLVESARLIPLLAVIALAVGATLPAVAESRLGDRATAAMYSAASDQQIETVAKSTQGSAACH